MGVGEFILDPIDAVARVDGRIRKLGNTQYLLLRALAERPGVPVSARELADRLSSDNVTQAISDLRAKVGRKRIKNVMGSGYTINGPCRFERLS